MMIDCGLNQAVSECPQVPLSPHLPDKPMALSKWVARRRHQLSARLFVLHERSRKITDQLQLDGMDANESTLAGTSDLLKRLLSAEKQMRQMLVDHPAAILVVDDAGLVQLSNHAARVLMQQIGRDQGSLYMGQPVEQVLPGVMTEEELSLTTDSQRSATGTLALVVKRSPVVWGQKPALMLMLHDVTPQVQAREELERALKQLEEVNQLKSEFITMASHEFRTPLTSVLSSLELMNEYVRRAGGELDEQFVRHMERHLNRSRDAIKHLDEMVAEMLVVEKSHSGQVECHPKPVELGPLAKDVLASLQPVAEQREVVLRLKDPKGVVATLDARLVQHILSNLVSNGIRYSDAGGEVTVSLGSDDRHVTVVVRDQGMGIPDSDLPRIFETFFRGENGQTTEGSGLGLSIVKRFVDLHSGHIEVDSKVGEGTTMTISFPVGTAGQGAEQ